MPKLWTIKYLDFLSKQYMSMKQAFTYLRGLQIPQQKHILALIVAVAPKSSRLVLIVARLSLLPLLRKLFFVLTLKMAGRLLVSARRWSEVQSFGNGTLSSDVSL